MPWSVFKDTMRYTWQITLIWGIGFFAMMVLILQISPLMTGLELVDLMEALPPWLLAAAGVSDAQLLGTVEGLIALGFFGKLALLFAAYPVVMGLRVTSQEETDGMMDVMLSLPLPRWRIIFEKFLAYALNIVILMAMSVLGLYVGQIGLTLEVNIAQLVLITLSIIPVMVFLLALTTLVGAIISHRQQVMTIVTAYIIFSFVVQTVGPMSDAPWMTAIESLALFTYYNVENTLVNGITAWHVALMLGLAAGMLAVSFVNFERRDIAV